MESRTESLSGTTLTSKPSTAFSASSSGSSRSRLLFGEVDSSCNQSLKSARTSCGLILCSSPSLLEFWNTDTCRDALLPLLPRSNLSTLRLVCHGISERVTSQAFSSVNVTFRARTFSKTARLAALQRIGHHIKEVNFRVFRSLDTMLPPLIDPWTGEQRDFTCKPTTTEPKDTKEANKQPRYGDAETTELLIKQYPPLFHAATNVHSFVQAMLCLTSLKHLRITCPGTGNQMSQSQGTDIVEIVLTSLRLAIEQAKLRHLDTLILSHACPADIMALSPLAIGAHPGSARRWSVIRVLDISMHSLCSSPASKDQIKLLREYIRSFKGLRKLSFRWLGARGLSPLPSVLPEQKTTHPALRTAKPSAPLFPHLEDLSLNNAIMSAPQIALLIQRHKTTLVEVDLKNVVLEDGDWQDAFGRLKGVDVKTNIPLISEEGDVPIMLAPSMLKPLPPPPTPATIPSHRSKGQTSEATKSARKILLAEEIQQVTPSRVRGTTRTATEEFGDDRKRRKISNKIWLQPQQLRRRCVDLFGWKMKNGPTLVVG